MGKLEGKVAVVTGASRGIGAAIARRLASEGARVAINYRHGEEAAVQVAATIRSAGGEALLVRADVTQEPQVQQLFEQVQERFGRLDILVNNAGVLEQRPLGEVEQAHFQRLFDTNVWGMALCCKHAAPRLQANGRIVNLSSILARTPFSGTALYSASKAAVECLTRVLAAELGARSITVNAVAPGLVETDKASTIPPEVFAHLARLTPLGRNGQPADVADMVAFLASEDSHWLTGQALSTSGGFAMY
jgi:3-oxoacyl-[acyl-carrier protein] reductase